MWPPSSRDARGWRAPPSRARSSARCAEMRASSSRLPGNCGWSASAIVFTYGVLSTGGSGTRRARAWSSSLRSRKVARSRPSAATSASKASSHSRVSTRIGVRRIDAPEGRGDDVGEVGHGGDVRLGRPAANRCPTICRGARDAILQSQDIQRSQICTSASVSSVSGSQIPFLDRHARLRRARIRRGISNRK